MDLKSESLLKIILGNMHLVKIRFMKLKKYQGMKHASKISKVLNVLHFIACEDFLSF